MNLKRFCKIIVLFIFIFLLGAVKIYFTFPIEHMEIIEKYAQKYNLDKSLIFSIIWVESKFDETAVSSKGASGLMQLMNDTAYWIAEREKIEDFDYSNIFEPEINIRLGCRYIRYLLDYYQGNKETALAAYNAGGGNVNKWLDDTRYSNDGNTLEDIPFGETKTYIKKIKFVENIYLILLKILK